MEHAADRTAQGVVNAAPAHRGVFVSNGEFWTLSFDSTPFSLKSVYGLTYIQRLLQNPGVEIHALDLTMGAGAGAGNEEKAIQLRDEGESYGPRAPGGSQPIVDDVALQSYRQKITELKEELDDALELHDADRAEEIRSEIDDIVRVVKALLDRRGRPRPLGSDEERARLNVLHAINLARQKIARNNAAFSAFLERSIRTGLFCSYSPGSELVEWRFALAGDAPLSAFVPPKAAPVRNADAVSAPHDAGRFVGREAERAALAHWLELAASGEGRVVLVGGSAGIGKSRLARETAAEAVSRGFVTRLGACYDREDSVPFVPVVEILEAALAARGGEPEDFRRLLGDDAAEIARIVPQLLRRFADIPPPAATSPEQSRRALFAAILAVIARRSAQDPILMVIEDLHWADEGTLALLVHFGRAVAKLPLLIVVTYRDDELRDSPEVLKTLDELVRLRAERLHLEGLSREAIAELLAQLSGAAFPAAFVERIYSYTEGNPLFVEELYRQLALQAPQGDPQALFNQAEIDLPHSLKLVIGRRLARVSTETLRVLGAAAVIGRSFTFALLAASTKSDPDKLIDNVEEAERAGLISSWFQYPETHFRFAHELIRRAVLDDLSMARQQRLHVSIAGAIESVYPAAIDDHAADLAHHLWNAGDAADRAKTINFLEKAGQRAVFSSANHEAVGHFKRALKLVEMLPESSEQAQLNLMLHVELGTPLTATQGFASVEVEAVWARARELCQRAGDAPQLFPVLWGLSVMHTARGKHRAARELAEQCVRLAEKTEDSGLILAAHHALGISLSILGEFESALEHLNKTIALYQPDVHGALAFQYGQDFGVVARSHAALDLWHLGFPEQAQRRNSEALELAAAIAHPYSQAAAFDFAAWLYLMGRDRDTAEKMAVAARKVSAEGGFAYWGAIAEIFHGAAIAARGQVLRAIEQIREGLAAYRGAGGGVMVPAFLSLLADTQGQAGQIDSALATIAEAQQVARDFEEHWWEPELHRAEGELLLRRSRGKERGEPLFEKAEQCFQRAVRLAHGQGAKSLELRAGLSLFRYCSEGKRETEGRRSLASVFSWFREGFDTPDLKEARRHVGGM